jgi:two-component system phosphate regulon sensor histidine kinase PhoR
MMSSTIGPRRMWDALGIRGKQFAVSLFVIVVAVIVGGSVAEHRVEAMTIERIERELDHAARTAAVALQPAAGGPVLSESALPGLAHRLGTATGARVTLVRGDGVVVGDSEVEDLSAVDNHSQRPEIVAAAREGRGVARRRSATTNVEFLYLARTADIGETSGFVRVALPLGDVANVVDTLRGLFLVAGLAALIVGVLGAAAAADLVSRRVRNLVARARAVRRASGDGDDVDALSQTFAALVDDLDRNLQALIDERDRYDALLKAMGEGVLVLDGAGAVVVANPAAGALLGVSTTLVGQPLPRPELATLAEEARLGRASSIELEVAIDTERTHRVLVRATPKPPAGAGAESSTPRGAVLVIHDVTEVRRLETLRRDFVANVSHELRTPCSVILANTETLLSGALDDGPRAQKFVEAIHRNAERLSRLIADLLELSRIEAGKVVIRRVPVHLRNAVDHVVDAVEPRAREKKMRVAVDVDEHLAVEGDPRALDQVLINLVDNAVKYTPVGGHVVVSARRDGEHALVVVEDDGPGVDEKHKGRLFERFYRVDSGRSRDVGGTGLGLAIVKHLVEAMEGRVHVEDATPRGTRFCVTLPMTMTAKDSRSTTERGA